MIRLEGITKSFAGKEGAVVALDGIDLTIAKGEIFGIIGSSGAGKSTLVRLINLLERPTGGEVFVAGERVTDAKGERLRDLRRSIGMVFQHFNLLSARTVAGNVAYPLELTGQYGRVEIAERVAALLARVGLSEHAKKYPRQLSGGQKQRVGIARALASEPQVLLCDEATSALDPQTTGAVLDLLRQINRDLGVTIVLITHEMDVIRRTCDRVAVLDRGRVVEEGPVTDVFLHPRHAATLRLVREAEPDGGSLDAVAASDLGGRAVRLTFTGAAAHQPILGRIACENLVDYAILAGRVGHIRETPYAQFTVSLSGRDVAGAIAGLRASGVDVELQAGIPLPQLEERPRHVV
ncbi:ATP-binding cassette domain-containing protein [Shinella curvata]|uniref:ATP-binding cassette domain-containing protein n=1 Tax=Shinella curvata TaxID=1817964 RepID=A0ABT8XIP2_9HYPH|nr:ATP-binding cassette domain-containing protein [Shinella curvata]MCJ8052527.1 ATP-binding cassette domain-containing protein [Shinella curvata]MDO6123607.1 ATP-binding cassette domain-containing protein [Shinella curvata]